MRSVSRRERMRHATVSEIKDGARRLLVAGGPQAISLRAIARDMGMTAPAIYRYFPSLEALVFELGSDLVDELRRAVEAARDAAGGAELQQLHAMAHAFRAWSIAHPVEFGLIFGPPTPGTSRLADACADPTHVGARLGAVFMHPLLELWRRQPFPVPSPHPLDPRLIDQLAPLRQHQGDVPIEVAYLFLSGWIRLHGLVSMEVFNHLRWAVTDAEIVFETELNAILYPIHAAAERSGEPTTAGPDVA